MRSAEGEVVTDDWRHDVERAAGEARVQPRHVSAAPHWLRCEFYSGVARCRLAEGHPGRHEGLTPAQKRVSDGSAP